MPKELRPLFDHPFTFLGSGNHTYAFSSADGQYVIKFFKQNRMRTQKLFLSKARKEERAKLRKRSLESYRIARDLLPKETQLVYLHDTKSSHLNLQISLIDQHGHTHKFQADDMEFLLQKRGILTFDHIQNLLKQGDDQRAVGAMVSLLDLVKSRAEKGIYDKDIQFFKNYGFVNGKPIEIDIGEFRMDPREANPEKIARDRLGFASQFFHWIDNNAPHLKAPFQEALCG